MGAVKIIGLTLMGVFPIFELTCYQIMRTNKSDIALRKRNTTMIHIGTIAAWLAYYNLTFGLFGGISCGVYHISIILLPPLTVGPQLLRGITLWGMLEHNRFMLKHGESAHLRRSKVVRSKSTFDVSQELISSKNDLEAAVSKRNANNEGAGSAKEKAIQVRKRMKLIVKTVKILLVGFPLVFVTVMVSRPAMEAWRKTNFSECFPESEMILNIGRAFTILFMLAATISVTFVRPCSDALGIRQEIIRNIAIILISNMAAFATSYFKKFQLELLIGVAQQMMLSFSMIVMPCYFPSSTSVFNQIRQRYTTSIPGYGRPIPNMHSGRPSIIGGVKSRVTLADKEREREMTMSLDAGLCILLSGDEGIKMFTEHCSREFSVENIRFWCVVNDFHRSVDILRAPTCEDKSDHDEADIMAFAEAIFEKYVRVGSEMQINVSAAQRKKVEEDMEKLSRIERPIFDSVQKEIYVMMSRHSYPRFLALKNKEAQASLLKHSRSRRASLVVPSNLKEST
eukprot:scaffold1388_cov267-Chaetoceros_neogracile.AAC.29